MPTLPSSEPAGENTAQRGQAKGLCSAIGAFTLWGVLPVYWKLLMAISPFIIVLHRVLWSFVFLLILEIKDGKLLSTLAQLKSKRSALIITVRSLILSLNWLTFIWAVNNGHIIESSLGYFLNPLVSTVLGILFFRERPNFPQYFAIFLACAGVGVQIIIFGRLPWIALTLAVLFAVYGAMRKADSRGAVSGLFLETLVITPFVLAGLIWFALRGDIGFSSGLPMALLVLSTGIVTSLPLLLFCYSTQFLNLTTVGLTQYISPSISMLIGVFVYHENITAGHMASFTCIWIALFLYSFESIRQYRNATSLNWRDKKPFPRSDAKPDKTD
jgi:chloramphenicol-sensitive protein RarD